MKISYFPARFRGVCAISGLKIKEGDEIAYVDRYVLSAGRCALKGAVEAFQGGRNASEDGDLTVLRDKAASLVGEAFLDIAVGVGLAGCIVEVVTWASKYEYFSSRTTGNVCLMIRLRNRGDGDCAQLYVTCSQSHDGIYQFDFTPNLAGELREKALHGCRDHDYLLEAVGNKEARLLAILAATVLASASRKTAATENCRSEVVLRVSAGGKLQLIEIDGDVWAERTIE